MTICLTVAFLGVGAEEMLIVLAVAMILFGPKELPKIARTLGKFMAHLRSVSDDFQAQVMRIDDEVSRPADSERAGENPKDGEKDSAFVASPPVAGEPVPDDPDDLQAEVVSAGDAGSAAGDGERTGEKPESVEPEALYVGNPPVVTEPVPPDQNKDAPHEPAG